VIATTVVAGRDVESLLFTRSVRLPFITDEHALQAPSGGRGGLGILVADLADLRTAGRGTAAEDILWGTPGWSGSRTHWFAEHHG